MKATGPVKPLQGKWIQPHVVQDTQGFGSLSRFTVYAPSLEQLSADGGWYYLGQTSTATSALIVRQNPMWRPILDGPDGTIPVGLTPPPTPPVTSMSLSTTAAPSPSSNSLSPPSLYNFSNEDAPFCPIAKYDIVWDASTSFDKQAKSSRHMFSLWEPLPQDPERFVPLGSYFHAHAPISTQPTIDRRIVCLNKKYVVKASLGPVVCADYILLFALLSQIGVLM